MRVIGIDTSNYTSSIAVFDGTNGVNCSKILPVKQGALGLRQSDAVFQHINSLPDLSSRLFSNIDASDISAVGVSTQPRAVEGSYMPCFMVGYSHAKMLSDMLHVPLYCCSHQQGHVAASAWSAGRMDILDTPHLAWHLSGGTTELLLVEPEKKSVSCNKIGGTSDISVGQLIDRTGVMLGLSFPAGKQLDELSLNATDDQVFHVKCNDLCFSLSGVENKTQQYYKYCNDPTETAGYTMRCICDIILRASLAAKKQYPNLPIVFSGGVASNAMLRKYVEPIDPIFALPQYSTDNAMGVAVLTYRNQED